MSEPTLNALASLQRLAQGDPAVMSFVRPAIESSFEESGLDPQTFMLVRIAALATLDATPASWLLNISVSGEAGLEPEKILGTLIAIAPVIGTARIISAVGSILKAFALAEDFA